MMNRRRRAVTALAVSVLALGVFAPVVNADPPSIPEPGSESAAATIGDLDDAGYDVQLQFENGSQGSPLSQCSVTDINTVGSAGSQPLAYVTVDCPK